MNKNPIVQFSSYVVHPPDHSGDRANLVLNFRVFSASSEEFNEEINRIIETVLDKDSEKIWNNPLGSEVDRLKAELREAKSKVDIKACEHKWKCAATDPSLGAMFLYCEKCGVSKVNDISTS